MISKIAFSKFKKIHYFQGTERAIFSKVSFEISENIIMLPGWNKSKNNLLAEFLTSHPHCHTQRRKDYPHKNHSQWTSVQVKSQECLMDSTSLEPVNKSFCWKYLSFIRNNPIHKALKLNVFYCLDSSFNAVISTLLKWIGEILRL